MNGPAAPPFRDVRVLELARGQAGRMAGMLLADLGADVVRVLPAGGFVGQWSAERLAWDRGKRFTESDRRELGELAAAADVVLSDGPRGELDALAPDPGLVRVWMPPHTATGRWSGLPDDPVLRSALGGFAAHHPSIGDRPVASVVPVFCAVHGAMGATAAAAGLLCARTSGHGDTVVVSGLHAMAACLCPMAVAGLDVDEVYSTGSTLPGAPNFRAYRAGDGRWLYLAALTPAFFFKALDILDRMDIMVLDGVDGEFTNLLVPRIGARAGTELEKTFAERTCEAWLAEFAAANIPAAPVSTRGDWLAGPFHAGVVELEHPVLGPVRMPDVAVRLPASPGRVRHLPADEYLVSGSRLWSPRTRPVPSGPPPERPLAGLRVVDLGTFLAAPFASALLADYGAEVVKIESPAGDPYRVFTASYAAVNQAKSVGTLDLRDAPARRTFLQIIGAADVLVDNMHRSSMERLGLGDGELAAAAPALVRCSVSAFGRSGLHADLPGFDPVLQSLSGLAAAQGGSGQPVPTSAPVHDIGTGVLAAFGVLAALYERAGRGTGQNVTVSLAATSGFLQAGEMTGFPGRPPTAVGGPDFPGPTPTRRLYRAGDGWLAVAAVTPEQVSALLAVTGVADVDGLSVAFAARPVEYWLTALVEWGVPACPVVERDRVLCDPVLGDVGLTHVVRDPQIGRLRVVRTYADRVGRPANVSAGGWQRRVADVGGPYVTFDGER